MSDIIIYEEKEHHFTDGRKMVLTKENEHLSLVIKKSSSIGAIVFDSSKKTILSLFNEDAETTLYAIGALIAENAEHLEMKNPKEGVVLEWADGVVDKYPNFKIEDIKKCFQMGRRGELFDDKDKKITAFNSIREDLIFAWLSSYNNFRSSEISKIRIEESQIHREQLKEPLATDEVWDKLSTERKNKLKEEGKVIMSYEEHLKSKRNLFCEIVDKRKFKEKIK